MAEGHRERLKRRFLKEGLQNFEPYQALELLLFYAIPRRDTSPTARELIKHFGSFSAVLSAPVEELKKVDAKAAEQIHMNNMKRTIRALEYFHQTGQPISKHNAEERQRTSPYTYVYFVLNRDRAELYRRIDLRVDLMLEAGLVDEVKTLKDVGYTRDMVAMQGLGYKEILDYLAGEITLDEAVYRIKRDTRHFAKRQLTWFRRERDVTWVELDGQKQEEVFVEILAELKSRGVID